MRALGDAYVREEFKRHKVPFAYRFHVFHEFLTRIKDATLTQAKVFVRQWEKYDTVYIIELRIYVLSCGFV